MTKPTIMLSLHERGRTRLPHTKDEGLIAAQEALKAFFPGVGVHVCLLDYGSRSAGVSAGGVATGFPKTVRQAVLDLACHIAVKAYRKSPPW